MTPYSVFLNTPDGTDLYIPSHEHVLSPRFSIFMTELENNNCENCLRHSF